jgi:hypothetical protein
MSTLNRVRFLQLNRSMVMLLVISMISSRIEPDKKTKYFNNDKQNVKILRQRWQ